MAEGVNLSQGYMWVWAVPVETRRWATLDLGSMGRPVSDECGISSSLTLEAGPSQGVEGRGQDRLTQSDGRDRPRTVLCKQAHSS